MKKISVILLLTVLLLTACNPLRRVQRNQKADSTTVDRSEIQKIVTDILKESGSFRQTVVEFYPPMNPGLEPSDYGDSNPAPPVVLEPSAPDIPKQSAERTEPPAVTPPAVKRIVRTEINTESERTTTTDSMAHNDIHTTTHSELSDKVVEKPPATVTAIKWIVVGLVALLLIILILKFSKIKIPFLK
ncbi:hypothetical protein LJC45_01615 [Alistipes sp. OttesenSCG-928-B03]|nr:hypothetical protein [Alistipes sp. OttesenSCG-928-B03]